MGSERLIGISGAKHGILHHIPSIAGHEVVDLFNNLDLAIICCGLGGLSGSFGSRLFASVAAARGVPCLILAATPFSAESARRREAASGALDVVLKSANLCIEFDNDKLSILAPNLPMFRAFSLMNSIMQRPVIDICSAMPREEINTLARALGRGNYGRFGLGLSRGDERVQRVVSEALGSPWFDYPLAESEAALAIYSSSDPWDREFEKILDDLERSLPVPRLFAGMYADSTLGDKIRLSLVTCRRRQ
jgi:cell division GTPase FtsZ